MTPKQKELFLFFYYNYIFNWLIKWTHSNTFDYFLTRSNTYPPKVLALPFGEEYSFDIHSNLGTGRGAYYLTWHPSRHKAITRVPDDDSGEI